MPTNLLHHSTPFKHQLPPQPPSYHLQSTATGVCFLYVYIFSLNTTIYMLPFISCVRVAFHFNRTRNNAFRSPLSNSLAGNREKKYGLYVVSSRARVSSSRLFSNHQIIPTNHHNQHSSLLLPTPNKKKTTSTQPTPPPPPPQPHRNQPPRAAPIILVVCCCFFLFFYFVCIRLIFYLYCFCVSLSLSLFQFCIANHNTDN